MHSGLILFAHGARDPRWALPFEAVAERVRAAQPGVPVRVAYLDFMTPSLPDAAGELAAAGCSRIEVLPMFLGAGGHVRQDLPRLLQSLRDAHPGLRLTLHTAVGEIDSVIAAMADAAAATLAVTP
jgi:sirohydrochlorin cobaltochelatase